MREWRRLLFVVLLLALSATAASAGRFSLAPSMVVNGEWTDNLLLTPEDSEDEKLADFSVTALPGLTLNYDTYRTHAFVGGAVGFRHYFEYDQYDGWPEYYLGALGVSYWATPQLRLNLVDNLMYYTDPRDQPFTTVRAVESLRAESLGNTMAGSLTYAATPLSTVEGGYTFGTTEFREAAASDVVQHSFFVSWTRRVSPSYQMVLFYNYDRALFSSHYDFFRRLWDDDYSMRPTFPVKLDNPDDFDTHTPGAGLIFAATPSLTFDFRSGVILPCYRHDEAYALDQPDWFQRVSMVKAFRHMNLTVSYNRTLAPAHGLAGAVLSQTVGSTFQQRWTRHFETTEEVGYTNYLQAAANVDVLHAAAEADYYFFNWLGLGLSYSYLGQVGHMTDETPDQHVNANTVSLHVTLTTPRPDWLRF